MTPQEHLIKSSPFLITYTNACGGQVLAGSEFPKFAGIVQVISVLSTHAKR